MVAECDELKDEAAEGTAPAISIVLDEKPDCVGGQQARDSMPARNLPLGSVGATRGTTFSVPCVAGREIGNVIAREHRNVRGGRNGNHASSSGGEAKLEECPAGGTPQADDREPVCEHPAGAQQAAKGRQRGSEAGHALEGRNRQQLYEIAKKQNIRGRSKMGEWDLIRTIRDSRRQGGTG